ncbi:MAG TPA: hypothetical protein VIK86_04715 [Candidatus Paceibacterota bacterium]
MNNIKYYFGFQIPYWKNKYLKFTFVKINYITDVVFRFTFWKMRKLTDIDRYEKDYGMNWWKHFDIFKIKTAKGKQILKDEKAETIEDLINKM